MTAEATFLMVLGAILIAFALAGIVAWYRTRVEAGAGVQPPPPPTLHEVYAADMDHWDKRYQQALMDVLGDECCLCDLRGGKYSCLIHRAPWNYPLSYIQRQAAEYRERTRR